MTFVAIIVIIIILKFIYDTYLTDNTESRYRDYKSTVFGIRTDGVYMFKQKGTSTWGEKFIITHILMFNAHGFVTYIEEEDNLQRDSYKNAVFEFSSLTTEDENCVKYIKRGNEIEIRFNGKIAPDAIILKGNVDYNNLLLTYENIYFNEIIGGPTKKEYFNDEKFKFYRTIDL